LKFLRGGSLQLWQLWFALQPVAAALAMMVEREALGGSPKTAMEGTQGAAAPCLQAGRMKAVPEELAEVVGRP